MTKETTETVETAPTSMRNYVRGVVVIAVVLSLMYVIGRSADLEEAAAVAILVQWVVALLHAVPRQDETLFDLTGSLTHATVSMLMFLRVEDKNWRHAMLTAMVWCWCVRLGSFLFLRIRQAGEDTRFAQIRVNPVRFFGVWNVQGLWVFLTLLPVLLSQRHATSSADVHVLDVLGAFLWALGFAMEVIADHQKTKFRADPVNEGKFIQSGLWYYSRHPNYFGEITMWIGIYLVVVHGLPTVFLQCMAALGPLFVTTLLLKVSGITLLEKQAEERWGALPSYQAYKKSTSVLVPMPKTTPKKDA